MADTLTISLDPRTLIGKKVKNLRKAGIIPVHLYGQGVAPLSLQCEAKTLYRLLSEAGMNTPITVTVPGQEGQKLTFVREIQWDPVRGALLHVDFLSVDVANEITAMVPIVLTGEAPAVQTTPDASVGQLLREVEVRALPLDVPSEFTVDLGMIVEPGDVIRLSDLTLPDRVSSITDLDEVIVRIEIMRIEVEVEEEEPLEMGEPEEQDPEASASSDFRR